jgi:hypothetical protein
MNIGFENDSFGGLTDGHVRVEELATPASGRRAARRAGTSRYVGTRRTK